MESESNTGATEASPLKNGAEQHKLTRADQVKGGSQKTVAKSLISRKFCTAKCPMFPCPFMPASHSEKYTDERGRHRCALKEMPLKIQHRQIRILTGGREGAIKELREIVSDIGTKTDLEGTAKAKALYFDKLDKYTETAYGKIIKQEVSGDLNIGLQAVDFRKAFKDTHKGEKDGKDTGQGTS